ncbi:MAG: CehA/McbA family metallohydrolase [Pseudothermotoga sp.]
MRGKFLLIVSFFILSVALANGKIVGSISDGMGSPLTARIRIMSAQKAFLITLYTDWNGDFEIDLAQGQYEFEITKGPEYERKIVQVDVVDNKETEMKITLNRLYDLAQIGWFGGDTHMHSTYSDGRQNVEQVALACSAAGLSWAVLSDHNTIAGKDEWLSFSDKGIMTIMGEEITTQIGHINALGVNQLVAWKPSATDEDIKRIFTDITSQKAVSQINHPFDLRNRFERIHVEGFDLIEIWNGGAPPIAEGLGNRESQEYWYELLNQGKKIAAVAGSDCHDVYSSYSLLGFLPLQTVILILQRELPGSEFIEYAKNNEQILRNWVKYGLFPGIPRTYVKVHKLNQENILNALKSGKSFLTNGPLLLVDINGAEPGETVLISEKMMVNIYMMSNTPIKELRLIQSGQTVYTISLRGKTLFQCSIQIDPKDGDWILVEAFGDYPVYALTNPIYFKSK